MGEFWNSLYRTHKADIEKGLSEFEDGTDLHSIFQDAIDAIQKNLEGVADYSDAIDLAYQQLEEIRKLHGLFNNEFEAPFTQAGNEGINGKFHSIVSLIQSGDELTAVRVEIERMINNELLRLEDTFLANTFRDKVESSVDFKGWVLRETYNETSEMTIFLDAFTIEYINFLEQNKGEKVKYAEISDDLNLDSMGLVQVLNSTMKRISQNNRGSYDEIGKFKVGFTLLNKGEEELTLGSFNFTQSLPTEGVDEEEPEEVTIPVKPVETMIPLPEGVANLDHTQIIKLYEDGNLLLEHAWKALEGETGFQRDKNKGFSLTNALDILGPSDGLMRDISIIFGKPFNEQEKVHLIKMIQYFLYIESSTGYNVANYEGVSTAKGYFQYLTGDGHFLRETMDTYIDDGKWKKGGKWKDGHNIIDTGRNRVRKVWGNNSYELGLSKIPAKIRSGDNPIRPIFKKELKKRGSPAKQDPTMLSAEEQIILFLSDLKERPGVKQYIKGMVQGNIAAVEGLYRAHHTNTDDETELKMLLAKRKVYGIPIEVYQRGTDSMTGLILPGNNMTSFFIDLVREFNPGSKAFHPETGLSPMDVMKNLDSLGRISFPVGKKVRISRTNEIGYAYNLQLDGKSYMRVNDEGKFSLR